MPIRKLALRIRLWVLVVSICILGLFGTLIASACKPTTTTIHYTTSSTTTVSTSTTTELSTISTTLSTMPTTTIQSQGYGGRSAGTGGEPCWSCEGVEPIVYWYNITSKTVWQYYVHYSSVSFIPSNTGNVSVLNLGPVWINNNTGISIGDWK